VSRGSSSTPPGRAAPEPGARLPGASRADGPALARNGGAATRSGARPCLRPSGAARGSWGPLRAAPASRPPGAPVRVLGGGEGPGARREPPSRPASVGLRHERHRGRGVGAPSVASRLLHAPASRWSPGRQAARVAVRRRCGGPGRECPPGSGRRGTPERGAGVGCASSCSAADQVPTGRGAGGHLEAPRRGAPGRGAPGRTARVLRKNARAPPGPDRRGQAREVSRAGVRSACSWPRAGAGPLASMACGSSRDSGCRSAERFFRPCARARSENRPSPPTPPRVYPPSNLRYGPPGPLQATNGRSSSLRASHAAHEPQRVPGGLPACVRAFARWRRTCTRARDAEPLPPGCVGVRVGVRPGVAPVLGRARRSCLWTIATPALHPSGLGGEGRSAPSRAPLSPGGTSKEVLPLKRSKSQPATPITWGCFGKVPHDPNHSRSRCPTF
jgi:hypothetical protein